MLSRNNVSAKKERNRLLFHWCNTRPCECSCRGRYPLVNRITLEQRRNYAEVCCYASMHTKHQSLTHSNRSMFTAINAYTLSSRITSGLVDGLQIRVSKCRKFLQFSEYLLYRPNFVMVGGRDSDEVMVAFRRGGKYRSSAKTLLPYRRKKTTGHPADNAGFFSTVLFSWLTGLVWKLYRQPVPVESLWQAPEIDQGKINSERFLRIWDEEVKRKGDKASMKSVFFRFIKTRFLISIICVCAFVACQFASNGVIIRVLLEYVEDTDSDLKTGLLIVAAMFLAEILRMLFFAMNFAVGIRTGVRLRSGVTMAVFKKVLNVPPTESTNIGEIVNLCSNDGDRLFEAVYVGSLLFTSPIIFILVTTYLCVLVGPIGLSGSGLFIILLILQVGLMKILNVMRQRAIVFTDKRVKAINEVVAAIKLIKMYAWEESFTKVVRRIRTKERDILFRASLVQSINMAIASLSPYLATIVTILFSLLLGRNITLAEGFTCFSMYNVMSFSLKVIPFALKNVAEATVAADRVQKVMERKEFTKYLGSETSAPNIVIEMRKASLSWPTDEKRNLDSKKESTDDDQEKHALAENGDSSTNPPLCLQHINLEVSKGSLVGVCGRVGCGKSSLIAGILGHLQPIDGSVSLDGSTAYCAQQAWIMNATIRDNITFGLPYDKEKYKKIVEACCLLPDFEVLQSGDLTEVGERGVNMSGGQKQRINIARALYMDKDIYLLDDPLSAVDAHVGKALFENAILALLKKAGKTVVLVTHRIEYLPYCDQVILMKSGRIWETGSHDDLMDNGGDYYQLYKMWCKEEGDKIEDEPKEIAPKPSGVQFENELEEEERAKIEQGRLMTTEESGQGALRSETYSAYFKAAGGWIVTILSVLLFVAFVCCLQFNSFWLSYWLNQGSGCSGLPNATCGGVINATTVYNTSSSTNSTSTDLNSSTTAGDVAGANMSSVANDRVLDSPNLYFYMSIFGYAMASTAVIMTLKAYVFMSLTLQASHRLHNRLFDKVVHATMEFFDTTPTGRILNRFQKDQDMLDNLIPLLLDLILTFGIFLISCVVFVAFVFPYFLVALVIMVPIFLIAFFMFKGAVREMRRQDNITRSPWLSHITTTITGIHTIRAYNRVADFIEQFSEHLNINTIPFFLFASVNRWLVTRLDFMTIILIAICTLMVVLTSGVIPAAYAALAVTSALMMSTIFQFTVRTSVETEANFVCAERIIHYIKTVPQEPGSKKKKDLDPKWPQFGSLRFVNVEMRYRDGLPLVLKDISFTINTCEKIGVVGRTGSGKSSLGVALFRLVELAGGRIEIDGVNISELSLSQLRSKIAIIPQEPVLFTGTVKYNLDPFNQYAEGDIWQSLERTHLKEAISSLPMKLEAPVSENGGNFSVGERQLMCLARALLRHNKILLLDEATASIDARTDELVQETIKEHFANCTLITIAHRLNTVSSCDRIMVLDRGCLKEFDTPENLSKNPESLFSRLLTSTKV